MHRPSSDPIGLQVIVAGQLLSRALDDELAAAGGSLAVWLALVPLTGRQHGAHPERSEAMGMVGGTRSDELKGLETAGLLIRKPDPDNPRVPLVELTEAGDALFHRLLRAVVAFDARLRTKLAQPEIAALSSTLNRLRSNVDDEKTS